MLVERSVTKTLLFLLAATVSLKLRSRLGKGNPRKGAPKVRTTHGLVHVGILVLAKMRLICAATVLITLLRATKIFRLFPLATKVFSTIRPGPVPMQRGKLREERLVLDAGTVPTRQGITRTVHTTTIRATIGTATNLADRVPIAALVLYILPEVQLHQQCTKIDVGLFMMTSGSHENLGGMEERRGIFKEIE